MSAGAFALDDSGKKILERSLLLYKEKRYKESRSLQIQLVKKYPKNSLYWFNLGTSSFMLSDYRLAKLAFARVEKLKSPLSPAAQLYRAKCEAAVGHKDKAREILLEIVALPNLLPALRDQAETDLATLNPELTEEHEKVMGLYQEKKYKEALAVIDSNRSPDSDMKLLRGLLLVKLERNEEAHEVLTAIPESANVDRVSMLQYLIDQTKREQNSRKVYWAFVEGSVGYNTNSYYDTTDDGSLKALYTKNYWGGGARLINQSSWSTLAGYSGYWEEVANAGNLQVVSHQIQFSENYDTPTDFFQVSPYYQTDKWGGVQAQERTGMRFKYRKLWSTSAAGGELDLTSVKGSDGRFSYLKGTDFQARGYWAIDTKKMYAQFYLDYDKSNTGDFVYSDKSVLPVKYEGSGVGTRLMYRHTDYWLHSLQAGFKRRNYSTLSYPDGKERIDHELSLMLRATRVWKSNLSTYTGIGFLRNSSTLDSNSVRDENFDATIINAGLQWDIL